MKRFTTPFLPTLLRRHRCYSSSLISAAFSCASSSTATTTTSVNTPADLLAYKKKAHALFMLRKTPHVALSAEAALQLICDEAQQSYIPEQERMTREEAAEFLRACHQAGGVIISPAPSSSSSSSTSSSSSSTTQMVYTDPIAVFDARRNALLNSTSSSSSASTSDTEFHIKSASGRQEHLKQISEHGRQHSPKIEAEHKLNCDHDEAARMAVKAHRRFWAIIGFAMSCQMLLFAYWTFLVYDWDAMEPFTYFVGCGYMCLFFAYFVCTRRAHTFAEMDKAVFSRYVTGVVKKAK